MDSVKIIHTADLHIDRPFAYLNDAEAAKRRGEILGALDRITALCRDEKADILLIAGDLFDGPSPSRTAVDTVKSALASISETRVFISAGNHDPYTVGSPYSEDGWSGNVHIFGTEPECIHIKELNCCVSGCSFEKSSAQTLIGSDFDTHAGADEIRLLCLHGDIQTESRYNSINMSALSQCGFDYIALGHVHERTDILRCGNSFYAYCGCPEAGGFDEAGSKGVYAGSVGRISCGLEYREICKRKYIEYTVDVSAAEDASDICRLVLRQLCSEFGSAYRDDFYKITLSGRLPFTPDLNELCGILSANLHFVKLRGSLLPDIDLQALSAESTLKGIFVRKMLERMENASESECERLSKALNYGLAALDGEAVCYEA